MLAKTLKWEYRLSSSDFFKHHRILPSFSENPTSKTSSDLFSVVVTWKQHETSYLALGRAFSDHRGTYRNWVTRTDSKPWISLYASFSFTKRAKGNVLIFVPTQERHLSKKWMQKINKPTEALSKGKRHGGR